MAQWRKVIVSGSNAELNHISASGNFVPVTTDGGALGSAGLNWSDLFLDSGAVVNFDNGDVTLTHSANALTVGGGDVLVGDNNVSGSSSSTGSFGYINIHGDAVIGGNITFGDADTDNISFSGEISSSLIPDVDDAFDLGSATKAWKDLYLEGDITLTDAGSVKATAGNLTVDSEAATLVLDGHTGVDIDATNSGKVSIDGAGGIDIGVASDVAIDIDSSTLDIDASSTIHLSGSSVTLDGSGVNIAGNAAEVDITTTGTVDINSAAFDVDASGAITIDGTSTVSIDGADDMNFTITSGEAGEDLTIQQIGGNDSSILITAAGTGADAVSIDATAGSMVVAPSLADGQTLTIGPSSATQMVFTPHGTAASEKISLINTSGTADDAIKIDAEAGGLTLAAGNDSLHIDADGTDADALNIDSAGGIDIDASAGLTVTSTTVAFDPSSTFDIDAAGAVTIDGSAITIGADDSGVAISIGHSTSETTINDNLTVTGNATIGGDLDINGTLTTIDTTNLRVADRFVQVASGSTSGDGGLVVTTAANGSGSAFFFDDSATRWGLTGADETGDSQITASPRQYITTVSQSAADPTGNPGDFGTDAATRRGMMHVNTSTGDIFIFS